MGETVRKSGRLSEKWGRLSEKWGRLSEKWGRLSESRGEGKEGSMVSPSALRASAAYGGGKPKKIVFCGPGGLKKKASREVGIFFFPLIFFFL